MRKGPSPAGVPENARQAILDAAIRVFARRGYAGTSVQDVLDEIGLSKPTLYYHFESKAGLFRSILDHAFDECFRLMRDAVGTQSPGEPQLTAAALALFRFTTGHADLTRLVFASLFAPPGEIPPECLNPELRRRNFDFVRRLLAEAATAGAVRRDIEPDDLAHGLVGAISHRIRSHLLTPAGRLDEAVATRVVALFLDGARQRP